MNCNSILRGTPLSYFNHLNRNIFFETPCIVCSYFRQLSTTRTATRMDGTDTSTKTMSFAGGSTSGSDGKNEPTTDHLTRTSANTRDEDIHSMKVADMLDLSPTVKEVILTAEKTPPSFTFKAGQWVDVFIPGENTVGGFSMSSSPQELSKMGTMRLAIKYSTHPPAHWIHKSCQIGDILKIRVGGDFYLSSDDLESTSKILLIAGGVGINPLTSIIRFIQDDKKQGAINPQTRVYLLFSAKDTSEHLFKDAFETYKQTDNAFNSRYFVTGKPPSSIPGKDAVDLSPIFRRILMSDLVHATKWLQQPDNDASNNDTDDIETYLCGPPSMIKSITSIAQALNLRAPHFEQWW